MVCLSLRRYTPDHLNDTLAASVEAGAVQADPALKAHPVSSFDTEKGKQRFQFELFFFFFRSSRPLRRGCGGGRRRQGGVVQA